MHFDISQLLDEWEYQPGQVVVRRFIGKDGVEKIQLRVDLGLLQMNAHGRPDGKHPNGHPSYLDYFGERAKAEGDEPFRLTAEDCALLQLEALQYHHRYICLLQLEDYEGVIRDTERNLKLFEFVESHAENEELARSLLQFFPQVLMLHIRGRAARTLKGQDYPGAIQQVEEGIERLREFYRSHGRTELVEQSAEISSLQQWVEEIDDKRPRTEREKLEIALDEAVKREDYEKAAQYRDALKNLNSAE